MFINSIKTTNYNEKCKLDTWSKRTQTKPILVPSAVEGSIKTTSGFAGLNQLATSDERPATNYNISPVRILEKSSGLRKAFGPLGLYLVSILRQAANFLSRRATKQFGWIPVSSGMTS
jgi:hypothetical protein